MCPAGYYQSVNGLIITQITHASCAIMSPSAGVITRPLGDW